MVKITVDFGPKQGAITREAIEQMLGLKPRRMKLSTEWKDALHKPDSDEKDWSIVLPFCETFRGAFTSCSVRSIGMQVSQKGGRCYTFLKIDGDEKDALDEVRAWLKSIGQHVAIRDCLALSFAIDYDRVDGNPAKPQTPVGKLRTVAKTYGAKPTKETMSAADKLVDKCVGFLGEVTCYNSMDAIVAMPPSDPKKVFDLPSHLAAGIAKALQKSDLSQAVKTLKARPPLKDTAVGKKLKALEGTIQVDPKPVKGKVILLVDDLYQSGVALNYVGMLLLEAGATKVFGLACEKTCRNDDNVSGG